MMSQGPPSEQRHEVVDPQSGDMLRLADDVSLTRFTVAGLRSGSSLTIGAGSRLKDVVVKFNGVGNRIVIGEAVELTGAITVGGGTDVYIGDRSTFGRVEMVAHRSPITIGADCMFSFGIELRTTDTHAIYDADSGDRINGERSIHIGDYVWVGKNASVLKGVTIGTGGIVAKGAVVSRDVSGRAVVAGNPARTVRTNAVWTRFEGTGRWQDDAVATSYAPVVEAGQRPSDEQREEPTVDVAPAPMPHEVNVG
jgi:acetyltransferase-like isoleucine patch superfamily enzyme